MKCVACGKERVMKELLYTADKELVCINPFQCNENHPNSVKNILKRGDAVKLYTAAELEDNIYEQLNIDDETKAHIERLLKPQSIRLSKVAIAHYLIELQKYRGLASISEAIRYCVSYTMKHLPVDAADEGLEVPEGDYESSDDVRDPISNPVPIGEETGIKFIVPDVPKSVNVNWDDVKTEAKKKKIDPPVQVLEDDDLGTF